MTDRPIIFSVPMVRALLDGRKTQTRRLLKLAGRIPEYIGPKGCMDDPTCWGWENSDGGYITVEGDDKDHPPGWRNGWRDWSGAFAPGDRLYVREAYRCNGWATDLATIFYRASVGDGYTAMCEQYPVAGKKALTVDGKWRPSIHMPRWASRLTLTVTEVRVQRLQEISEADAVAEGVSDKWSDSRRYGFSALWDSLHGPEAWDANPWVVAVSFDVALRNIDAVTP